MEGLRAPRWVCDIVSSRMGSADAKWGSNSRHCAGCCLLKTPAGLLCVCNANLIPKFEALRRCAHDAALKKGRCIAVEWLKQRENHKIVPAQLLRSAWQCIGGHVLGRPSVLCGNSGARFVLPENKTPTYISSPLFLQLICVSLFAFHAAAMGFNWRKYEAWRKHPMLNNNLRHSMPGLGIATVAFAGFVAYDKLIGSGSSGGKH